MRAPIMEDWDADADRERAKGCVWLSVVLARGSAVLAVVILAAMVVLASGFRIGS